MNSEASLPTAEVPASAAPVSVPPSEVPFSQVLREATDEAHQAAEHSPFVTRLTNGELARPELARFVRQLHAVYTVLEEAVAACDDPVLVPFLAPELARTDALVADLDYLAGPGWRDEIALTPATEAYCDRMRERCFTSSPALLAHHYVRYMGDLSGGQIIGRLLARVYELPDGLGTAFYRFERIPSPKAFKDRYRAHLDALPWDEATRAEVVAEAVEAFECNRRMFADLETPAVATA